MSLDNPETELELNDAAPLPDGEAALDATAEVEAEPEQLSIVIEGEDAPVDEYALDPEEEATLGDKGRKTLKQLRKVAEENAKRARELERKLAAVEAQQPKAAPPKRPTLEECGFDDDVFAQRMEEYTRAQIEVRAEQAKAEERAKAQEEEYRGRHARYVEQKASLRVEGFDAAEDAVKGALNVAQQSMIVRNVDDPAKVVYALGRHPKALAELAAVTDPDRFAYKLAQLERKIAVTNKPSVPQPESKLRGGGAAAAPVAVSAKSVDALRVKAEQSGDYTAYFAAQRALREAGKR
jgi:hypothetical protein